MDLDETQTSNYVGCDIVLNLTNMDLDADVIFFSTFILR